MILNAHIWQLPNQCELLTSAFCLSKFPKAFLATSFSFKTLVTLPLALRFSCLAGADPEPLSARISQTIFVIFSIEKNYRKAILLADTKCLNALWWTSLSGRAEGRRRIRWLRGWVTEVQGRARWRSKQAWRTKERMKNRKQEKANHYRSWYARLAPQWRTDWILKQLGGRSQLP